MTTPSGAGTAAPRRSGWDTAARGFAGLALLVAILMPIVGITPNVVIFASIPLAVVLACRRYGRRTAMTYLVVTFVVANIFENLSIATGFPFGHYYYPGTSPRIINFPIQVAFAYSALGMICWLTAVALLDNADQRLADRGDPSRRINIVALPALAAALMTMFDLGSDSSSATVQQAWVWTDGGGVFGVPWTNYLGWWLVTYIFFQIFALVLARKQATAAAEHGREPLALATGVYVLLSVATMVLFFTQGGTAVDRTGQTWNVGDLYSTLFSFNLFGPVVIAALAAVKLARNDIARVPARSTEAGTRS